MMICLKKKMASTTSVSVMLDLVQKCEKLRMLYNKKSKQLPEKQLAILNEMSEKGYKVVSTIPQYISCFKKNSLDGKGYIYTPSDTIGMVIYLDTVTIDAVESAYREAPAKLTQMLVSMGTICTEPSTVDVSIFLEDYHDAQLYYEKGK